MSSGPGTPAQSTLSSRLGVEPTDPTHVGDELLERFLIAHEGGGGDPVATTR